MCKRFGEHERKRIKSYGGGLGDRIRIYRKD